MYQINFNNPCHVHFIGIGGISMSGLAFILLQQGFQISGSDAKREENLFIISIPDWTEFNFRRNNYPGFQMVLVSAMWLCHSRASYGMSP